MSNCFISEADLTDADFFLESLDTTLFPGLSSSIEAHNGFASEQAQTATTILSAVQKGMSKFGATKVTMVGHSLGAALALLDSIYLPLHLPSSTTFMTVTYGMPRVSDLLSPLRTSFLNSIRWVTKILRITSMHTSI